MKAAPIQERVDLLDLTRGFPILGVYLIKITAFPYILMA